MFDTTKIDALSQDGLMPKVGIPNGATCYVLLNDVAFPKKKVEEANQMKRPNTLFDGIVLRYVIIGYYKKGADDKPVWVPQVNFHDDVIQFPEDKIFDTGDREYASLTGFDYIDVNRITNKKNPFGGYKTPISEVSCAVFYNASFMKQTSRSENELLAVLMALNKAASIDWKDLGGDPSIKRFPIMPLHRYVSSYYRKADLDEQGKPKPNAELQYQISYTGYNRDSKTFDLKDVKTQWIDEQKNGAIALAVAERAKAKKDWEDTKKKASGSSSAPAGTGVGEDGYPENPPF